MGDRYHWAWGLIDFGNGTFKEQLAGLSRLWEKFVAYDTKKSQFIHIIDSIFQATHSLTKKDGSLEEAFLTKGHIA